MATTVVNCGYINPGGTVGLEKLVHTGTGRLLGLLVSNGNAAAQTVTFYDATSAADAKKRLLVVVQGPATRPFYLMFPREQAPTFSEGLYVEPNSADVALWAVLYS